ncbi:hypothetical protein Plhal304r1_c003g0009681 [Plasmopara halstedii]
MTEFSAPPQVLLTASTDKFCFIQLRCALFASGQFSGILASNFSNQRSITSCKVEVSSHHDLAAITSLDVHAD